MTTKSMTLTITPAHLALLAVAGSLAAGWAFADRAAAGSLAAATGSPSSGASRIADAPAPSVSLGSRGAGAESRPSSRRIEPTLERVLVNGVEVAAAELATLEQRSGRQIPAGSYWYDPRSGAWGLQGGPAAGVTQAGLALGGELRADASGGDSGRTTGVFVNGRELHPQDVAELARLGPVVPGRYWIDARGDFGHEGAPQPLGNLLALSQRGSGGSYLKRTPGGYVGGDPETSYFFDPSTGASVIPGEGVSW